MKRLVLLLPVLLFGWNAYAQGIGYGFKISKNASFLYGNYIITEQGVTANLDPKLASRASIGGFLRYNVTPAFSIQPEFLFTTRGVRFKEDVIIRDLDMRVEGGLTLKYIEIPLLFRLSTWIPRPPPPRYQPPGYTYNAYTGLSFAYNTSARFSGNLSGDVFGVDFDEPFSSRVRNQFQAGEISFILGTGFEYGQDDRFVFDLRYSISINDIGKDPEFSSAVRNGMVAIMIGVLFR